MAEFISENLFAIVAVWAFLFIGFTGFFRVAPTDDTTSSDPSAVSGDIYAGSPILMPVVIRNHKH